MNIRGVFYIILLVDHPQAKKNEFSYNEKDPIYVLCI